MLLAHPFNDQTRRSPPRMHLALSPLDNQLDGPPVTPGPPSDSLSTEERSPSLPVAPSIASVQRPMHADDVPAPTPRGPALDSSISAARVRHRQRDECAITAERASALQCPAGASAASGRNGRQSPSPTIERKEPAEWPALEAQRPGQLCQAMRPTSTSKMGRRRR